MTHLSDQDRRGKMMACLERLTTIMDLLRENGWMTASEVAKGIEGVTERTVRRDLKMLQKVDWIDSKRVCRPFDESVQYSGTRHVQKYRALVEFTPIVWPT